MDIYAPLAERIGMYEFMKEMQTLAFRELEPEAYESITKRLDTLRAGDHDQILKISAGLEQLLARAGIEAEISGRSEEHTSELQSLMRISYAVFCLKKKKNSTHSIASLDY